MNRHDPRRSALLAAVAVALCLAFVIPAAPASAAEGEMRWGLHVTLAPKWLDPAET